MLSEQQLEQQRQDAIESLEEAITSLEQAYELIDSAKQNIKNLPTDYNMPGNMDAYVLNHIKSSNDSLVEKLGAYIEELNELRMKLE